MCELLLNETQHVCALNVLLVKMHLVGRCLVAVLLCLMQCTTCPLDTYTMCINNTNLVSPFASSQVPTSAAHYPFPVHHHLYYILRVYLWSTKGEL